MKTEFRTGSHERNHRDACAALTAAGYAKSGYYWLSGAEKAIVDCDQPISVFVVYTVNGKWPWEVAA